jgi:hypothetical protein
MKDIAAAVEKQKALYLKSLRGYHTLVSIPEYQRAFRTAYGLAAADQAPITNEQVAKAKVTMRRIEKEKKLDGFLPPDPTLVFGDVKYIHRASNPAADLHEFTPQGQDDLERFTDMVTINLYVQTTDGEGLAKIANAVLANYKANNAQVLGTSSVPLTKEKPAEHLIVVSFPSDEFTEVAFARFLLHNGVGTGVIYSHRAYGAKGKDEMTAWLNTHRKATEQNLWKLDTIPNLQPPK